MKTRPRQRTRFPGDHAKARAQDLAAAAVAETLHANDALVRFQERGAPLRESAEVLEIGDVDGDGQLDVYGFSSSNAFAHLGLVGGGSTPGMPRRDPTRASDRRSPISMAMASPM